MRLEFKTEHLSIDRFNSVDIPNFVVLTGVNGAGKSHLIQAIKIGAVQIEGLNNPSIVQFNYETFRLENEGTFNATQLVSEREQAWNFYQQQLKHNLNACFNLIRNKSESLTRQCEIEGKSFWNVARLRTHSLR